MIRRNTVSLIVALALALGLCAVPAAAQDSEEPLLDDLPARSITVGEIGYAIQGEADIDGGGGADVQVNRFDAGILDHWNFQESWRWTNAFFFGANDYDFEGGGFAAGNPWETILSMRYTSTLRRALNEEWGVFGGGVFMFAPETSADWGDSFTGGGVGGFDWRPNSSFFVSVGLAVLSQIEDDALVTPSVVMSWTPVDQWSLRAGAVPASGGAAVASELAWRIADPLEVGLGVLFHQRRFRLNDSGPSPDGVGEDNNMPLRVRVGWDVTEQVSLHFSVGAVLAGELQLDDQNGNRINRQDYDPAPYGSVRLTGRF